MTKEQTTKWLVGLFLAGAALWGLYNGLAERKKPGYITQPIEMSGPCPPTVPSEDGELYLDHCFLHKSLHRNVCEYRRTVGRDTRYLYVACGQ